VERCYTNHASTPGLIGFAALYRSYNSIESSICRKTFGRESNSSGTPLS
jgi:hypothetical protein